VPLSPQGREALLALVRRQAARKAAASRAAGKGKKREDPLLEAIRSGEPDRLDRFTLERIDPKRLQAALPIWRQAPAKVKAHLLRVPRELLSEEIWWEALRAWGEAGCRPRYEEPVPVDLLQELSPGGRLQLLRAVLHRQAVLDRLPADEELGPLLLEPLFQDQEATAAVRNGLRLLAWKEELEALAQEAAPPLPEDLARQLAFYCQWGCRGHSEEAVKAALQLRETIAAWPEATRRAAARAILEAVDFTALFPW